MRRPLALAVALHAVAVLVAPSARAMPPDRWDRARAPDLAREEDLVEAARVILGEADASRRDRALSARLAGHAKTILDNLGARTSLDARRRFLLGEALALLGEDGEVVKVMGSAIELSPEHPMAVHGAFEVAIAFARAGKAEDEIDAWTRYLELQPAVTGRHLALYNRAEARLRLGDLEGAERDYRASIKIQDDALARYGLAITLDRSSRFSDAMNEAKKAVGADRPFGRFPTRLLSDGVFFVPDYERHWYLALREIGLAADATETHGPGDGGVLAPTVGVDWESRAHHLRLASVEMERWIAKAPSSDPWVGLAKGRKKLLDAMTKAADDEAKKRAKAKKPAAPPVPPLR